MELSPVLLSKLLFYSLLWGLALGAINDVSRIIRVFLGVRYSKRRFDKLYSLLKFEKRIKVKKNSILLNIVILLQDIVLFVIAAFGIVILNYYLNDGEIRIFTVASMLIGSVLWYMTLGKLMIAFSEPIVVLIKFVVYSIIKFICIPMRYIIMLVARVYKKICAKVIKTIANNRNMRYNNRKKRYYTELSSLGFIDKDTAKG